MEIKDFSTHQIYNKYAADKQGNVIHMDHTVPTKGNLNPSGYYTVMVRSRNNKKYNTVLARRFIWECFNGLIPKDKVIDHINNNKQDNRLENLQICTHKENCKKSARNRDYSFVSKNHRNKKLVIATRVDTSEVSYFHSLYSVQQSLKINCGIVKMCCEGKNMCKSGISKLNGYRYKFQYINELPKDYKNHKEKK